MGLPETVSPTDRPEHNNSLHDLQSGEILAIRTRNSRYVFWVIEGGSCPLIRVQTIQKATQQETLANKNRIGKRGRIFSSLKAGNGFRILFEDNSYLESSAIQQVLVGKTL